MNNSVYLKNVVTLRLDEDKCTGCTMCLNVCPHEVFKMNGKHVLILNRDACMECGACSLNCPAGAIAVQSGVGCAAAVINSMLGRNGGECCCGPNTDITTANGKGGCCS
jgi:NAD-dependent dihydropyrimidine dehydrogenase PreA subunit